MTQQEMQHETCVSAEIMLLIIFMNSVENTGAIVSNKGKIA